jgi:WD40 repeat protein
MPAQHSAVRRQRVVSALWDVRTGKNTATLEGRLSVLGLAFNSDGKTLASGSDDRTIKLWDVATDKNIACLQGHTDAVRAVAFSPDGETLASGSYDKSIKLWRINKAQVQGKSRR